MTTPTDEPRRLRVEYLPLDEIRPAERNPKDHDLAEIRASIDRHGLGDVAGIVDERTGRLVAGHGRLTVLAEWRDAGAEPPPGVIVVDDVWTVPLLYGARWANDTEAEAFLIGHNRVGEIGGWVPEVLSDMLGALPSPETLAGTGFDVVAVQSLFGKTNPSDEWKGMPDYENRNENAPFSVSISFGSEADRDAFFKLIDRPIRKRMWWPADDGIKRASMGADAPTWVQPDAT